jgi:NAD(P)-dependent dehydrogenase (short-subunit alcohol dehydrogenase family)
MAEVMNSDLTLKGRVALVTGAAKRLGRHVALHLAGEGADIAVHYGNSETEAHTLVEEIEKQGRRAGAFSADLTNVEAIPCLIEQVAGHFGRLGNSSQPCHPRNSLRYSVGVTPHS